MLYNTIVHRNTTKFQVHWSQKLAKRYKGKAIFYYLYGPKEVSGNFDAKMKYIMEKFRNADYVLRFINNMVNHLIKPTNGLEESYLFSVQFI